MIIQIIFVLCIVIFVYYYTKFTKEQPNNILKDISKENLKETPSTTDIELFRYFNTLKNTKILDLPVNIGIPYIKEDSVYVKLDKQNTLIIINDIILSKINKIYNFKLIQIVDAEYKYISNTLEENKSELIKKFKIIGIFYENTTNRTLKLQIDILREEYNYKTGGIYIDNILIIEHSTNYKLNPINIKNTDNIDFLPYKINGIIKPEELIIETDKVNSDIMKYFIMSYNKRKRSKCYIPKNTELTLDIINANQKECEDMGFIWDKYTENNSDCPFYKANRNYENEFGGAVNGYCEMPIGVERISPTKFINPIDPVCYNCKENIIDRSDPFKRGYCCKEQLQNRTKYPNLLSPDYAFNGDLLHRIIKK